MIDWFLSLTSPYQVFYGIGIFAIVLTLLQGLLSLMGVGLDSLFDSLHLNIEIGDGSGVSLLSGHSLSAFFLGLGWGGVLSLEAGTSVLAATLIGTTAGLLLMSIVILMLTGLMKLQSDGTLHYENAVGEEATVYVTIPGSGEDAGGQIQVKIQGRLVTAAARRESVGALSPGTRVTITGMAGPTSFLVEPLNP